MQREELIDRLHRPAKDPWDVLVVGGGAVGLGAALDAATRGYRTALLERHDFCKGTSSRSTKLIHGGVRYLRQGQVSLVREALRERGLLLRNAPSIVKPLRFLIPCANHSERLYYWLGMKCYDALAGRLGIEPSRHLSMADMQRAVPTLRPAIMRGGVCYHDAQFNDAALGLALAQTFLQEGGLPLNYMRVQSLRIEQGRVSGVTAVDEESGRSHDLHAKVVINAAGVFGDSIRRMENPSASNLISPSQGIHLVVEQKFLSGPDALLIPRTKDGRVLFAIPWQGRVVLGTTDTPVDTPTMEPQPLETEIDYLLEHLADYFDPAPQRENILSAFAGLRPLVKPPREAGGTAKISREHSIVTSAGGLVSVLGGKWTTYRSMAVAVVDQAAMVADLPRRESRTSHLRLGDVSQYDAEPKGSAADGLLAPPSPAGVRAAVSHQFARTVEDVLARRYRCLLLDAAGSVRYARETAHVIAEHLGHDAAWVDEQVHSYTRLAYSYALRDPALVDDK